MVFLLLLGWDVDRSRSVEVGDVTRALEVGRAESITVLDNNMMILNLHQLALEVDVTLRQWLRPMSMDLVVENLGLVARLDL